ncbi:hypothetical protein TPDSL_14170 [Terrisporobacter petrolearius]|uniref:hypothetical protein n=1 Tax=Terrisporobacter petrolearius TaxID=1460447 RepID=UPI003366379E
MKILVNGEYCTEIIKNEMRKDNIIEITEKLLKDLKSNSIKYRKLVIVLALVVPSTTLNVFAQSEIIEVGYVFWDILKDIAYVICLLGAAIEAIKCVASGTVESLGKVGIKYLAFAFIFKFLPKVVSKIFSM